MRSLKFLFGLIYEILISKVKSGLYLAAKMLCGHGAKIPMNFFLKYNACVMHHIWIPYSNGFMLKKIFQIDVFCGFI